MFTKKIIKNITMDRARIKKTMTTLRLLTWLDVRRTLAQKTHYGSKLPEEIVRLSCFSDALEVGVKNEDDRQAASSILKEWFGNWYQDQEDRSFIELDIDNAQLPVEFIEGEDKSNQVINIRPFWKEVSCLEDQEDNSQNINLPELNFKKPELIAFYSFKGGVGRSLHLAAYMFSLLEQAKEINQALKLLVIDADLEAPGLTYWNAYEKQQPSVSFIDFIESYHYPPVSSEETINFFAREIKKSAKIEGRSTRYFLPTFIKDEQLLDTPILPENLVINSIDKNSWEFGDAIYKLGQAINADYVLIDLRTGLSEISSPILFDPRIQRFLVTTLNKQSLQGTNLVLQQISHLAPPESEVSGDNNQYYDPSVIVSMLTPELRNLPAFENALSKLQSSYVQSQEDQLYTTRLEVKETYFSQELLYVNNWQEAREKLAPTSIMSLAKKWAEEQLSQSEPLEGEGLDAVSRLQDTCQKYIYAEEGEGENLLITEPLKNLATNFQENLPRVVSIGAKGAGKTFNYIQLSRWQYWEKFLQIINIINNTEPELSSKTYIFPLLQSGKLSDKARNITDEARRKLLEVALNDNTSTFSPSDCQDRIKRAIHEHEQDWSEPDWTEFWIQEIGKSLAIDSQATKLSQIDDYLKEKLLKVIFFI